MIPALVGLLLRCARVLPPGVAWWLGGVLGHAFGGLPGRDQRRAREHLATAFPERDPAWVAATARAAFRHTGRMALWSLATLHADPRRLRRGVALEGADHLRELVRASRRGEGTMVFTAHFGNWELLVRLIPTMVPSAVIARRLRWPLADELVQRARAGGGARVIYQDEDPREVLRTLRQGHLVGTLVDQDIPALAGTFVPWFGIPAWTPSGPAALAQLARVPVQCVTVHRRAGRWVVRAGPRLAPRREADRAEGIRRVTAAMTAEFEALVRRHPEQWVWWHKRWRTRPPAGDGTVAGAPPAPGSRP